MALVRKIVDARNALRDEEICSTVATAVIDSATGIQVAADGFAVTQLPASFFASSCRDRGQCTTGIGLQQVPVSGIAIVSGAVEIVGVFPSRYRRGRRI